MIEHEIPLLEEILGQWKERIGSDYQGYRNHVYRMLHFCFYLSEPSEEERKKLIISAAFHDIGIWSAGTVDYLPPSVEVAMQYLKEQGLDAWCEEVALIIDMHHKIRHFKDPLYPLVEVFRNGDLVDFSLGVVKHGVPKRCIEEIKQAFPNAGFHKRLMQLTWSRLKSHPLSPAPMMKW